MLNAYAGIISDHGLEVFVPETDHALCFLLRRVTRKTNSNQVCFWAVMEPSAALAVRSCVASGRYRDALFVLQTLAGRMGPVWPEDSEPADSRKMTASDRISDKTGA